MSQANGWPARVENRLGNVSRETSARLALFRDLLTAENERQNLVSSSTIDTLWQRHILDSAQLAALGQSGAWADVGSGAGLPGIVIACLVPDPVLLIEPRKLRAEFLRSVIARLGLGNVRVACRKAARVTGKFDVITARAVASLDRLLGLASHLSHSGTIWVLPKGKSAKCELAQAQLNWHCVVREVPSQIDPEATILVLSQVEAKRRQ